VTVALAERCLVLGIETSCDETAAAVVNGDYTIRANVVLSQEEHARYGGVVPELASRAHVRAICGVCRDAVERSGIRWDQLSAIAVTHGPGLVGSLVVGVAVGKGLALSLGCPLVGVHHLEAHVFATRLSDAPPRCPFIALLVSGGHTELVLARRWGEYETLGRTRDDAAGEAFDKVAKLLGLIPQDGAINGGRYVSECARRGDPSAVRLPRALMAEDTFDFSFSGLKTAVLNHIRGVGQCAGSAGVDDLAASFEAAVVEVLVHRALQAMAATGVHCVALAGGVAANRRLREELARAVEARGGTLHCPPPALCTDNAAMVAAAGVFHYQRGEIAGLDLDAVPRQALA